MMDRTERCETCRFAFDMAEKTDPQPDDSKALICRRFPPQVFGRNSPTVPPGYLQPEVDVDDWCGEWEAADPPGDSNPSTGT